MDPSLFNSKTPRLAHRREANHSTHASVGITDITLGGNIAIDPTQELFSPDIPRIFSSSNPPSPAFAKEEAKEEELDRDADEIVVKKESDFDGTALKITERIPENEIN